MFHSENLCTIRRLIREDWQRYTELGLRDTRLNLLLTALLALNHCFAFSFWLRLASRPNPFQLPARWMHRRLSRKYCLAISPKMELGGGFYMAHGFCIIINSGTTIGRHFSLAHMTSIGTNHRTPATIGDNVYIAPGACLVENVRIGDNARIGAGAIVIKDVPADCTAVGNPARNITHTPT